MKLLELIGLPVYATDTGKQWAKVKDVKISQEWAITYIELENRLRKTASPLSIRWEEITTCGEDAIMIAKDTAIRQTKATHTDIERPFLTGQRALKDLPVVSSKGIQLGWVSDVYFDPKMDNQITGLEISDGLLSDLLEGRRQIKGTDRLKWGTDVIIFEETESLNNTNK